MMDAALPASWQTIAVAAGLALLTAFAGGALTKIGPWYEGLRKPSWQPGNWVFPVVWTTIFVLLAASGVLAWNAAGPEDRMRLAVFYGSNGLVNVLWSLLFFTLQRPDWALIEVAFLWVSILLLVVNTAPLSTLAAVLILPYLIWVSVAAYLNLTIVRLNPSFAKATT